MLRLDAFFLTRGLDLASMSDDDVHRFRSFIIHGSPDEVGEQFSERLTLGIDGFTVNAVANGHVEGRVALLGKTLSKVLA